MRRSISTATLLFASVSAILGSGWLFTAYYTATLAGPATLLSWVIGGVALIIVAFVFAETSAMLPIVGSSSRIPQYTHGTIVSFIFSWMIWLAYAALVPTEVQAIIQYLNFFFPSLTHAGGRLTEHGYLLATLLMLTISAVNIFSLRWLMRANSFLTLLKIIIPIILSIVIITLLFSPHHMIHPDHSFFMPFGFHGMMAAVATGGIVFAFNGFKQACEMAGEAKRPSRALPIAIIGSIGLTLIIYLLLQIAFLISMNGHDLAHGWTHLNIAGGNSPFAGILHQDRINWLIPLLYLGAIIGPFAAGLMYASSSSRSLYAKSKNGYLPVFFQKMTTQGNPVYAIIINFALGMLFFAPLPGWKNMITFLTSLMAITYAIGPITLLALRQQLPEQNRPFRLPFPKIWTTTAFYICTLLAYWTGWNIISKLSIALIIGLIILFTYHFGSKRGRQIQFHWRASLWMWPYFIGLTLISYLGNFGHGLGIIPFGWDFLVIAVFCVIIMYLAYIFKLPAAKTQEYIEELKRDHPVLLEQAKSS